MASARTLSSYRPWLLFGGVVAVAVFRAALATPLADALPAKVADQEAAFVTLASEEKTMRRDAAKEFPADQWSQDDAFHNAEYRRADASRDLDHDCLPCCCSRLRPLDAFLKPGVQHSLGRIGNKVVTHRRTTFFRADPPQMQSRSHKYCHQGIARGCLCLESWPESSNRCVFS